MPHYDYRCSKGKITEAVHDYGVSEIDCPCCGGVAVREAVYAEQTIIGETVARPNGQRLGKSAKNKHGLWDMGIVEEAQHELVHDAEKAGIEPPDLWSAAKAKSKRPLQTATTE